MNNQGLPSVDEEIDRLYVTTNWLIATRNSSTINPEQMRIQFLNQLREQSNLCRHHHQSKNTGNHFNICYDNCPNTATKVDHSGENAFDWFGPSKMAPNRCPLVVVYIHGGYWQAVELAEASHWANPVTNAGAFFVALSYRLAPWQNIKSMPHQLCLGMQKVYKYTMNQIFGDGTYSSSNKSENDDKTNLEICLVGHSAGVQLALEMLEIASYSPNQDWFPAIKYLILVSGVYDLRPLLHTSINRALKLRTVEEAWALSPLRNIINPNPAWVTKPMHWLIVWAQYDSPALIEQSEQIAEYLKKLIGFKKDSSVETFIAEAADHFTSIGDLFGGPDQSMLMRKILEFIKLIEKIDD